MVPPLSELTKFGFGSVRQPDCATFDFTICGIHLHLWL